MNQLELYSAFRIAGESGEIARALLSQTHWFVVNAEFDPKTGGALPQSLSAFLAKVARPATNGAIRDRLWRIVEHSRGSVERLIRALNASPRREQSLLPVHAVRELDANSFIKLSNRPGRTIREKLAGKPYLQAVRRFQSVNLPENRLLKAFVTRLAELLELRRDCLSEREDELLPKIESWLLSDEAGAIDRWDNLPPNNTLLSHRDYRRVWDAWRWLQTLDDDIARDFSQLQARDETMRLWNEYAQRWADGGHCFAEMPVLFVYEKFEILPWSCKPLLLKESRQKIPRSIQKREIAEPVCVDLTLLRPSYGTDGKAAKTLPSTLLWQQWKREDETVEIELFDSDAVWLHPQSISISAPDFFFTKDNTSESFDRPARAFVRKLREEFKTDTLIWLVPDFLNDFELEVIRRNLNSRFPDAEPLPRSVAAVFEQVDYLKIKNDGFPIVVIDTIGGKTCVTKLLARRDPELNKCLPETGGFYWERCPPVILDSEDSENTEGKSYDLITVDGKGQWYDATRPAKSQFIDTRSLKSDSRVGQFVFCINLTKSPVVGGIRLHSLQQRAGDIPLWRDQIPELSIKVMKDGLYQRFHLVSRGTTVKPIRGLSVKIPVDDNFTLSFGKSFYQFAIFQGENADELGFSARLDSPAFPLKEDVVCKLNLAFEYGTDEPYKLVFTPLNTSFPPVRATWRRTEEVISTDAPAPEYPEPLSWESLRRWTDAQGQPVDLLEWLLDSLARLSELIPTRSALTITSRWTSKTDDSGQPYWFAFSAMDIRKVYCNTKNCIDPFGEDPNDMFPLGAKLFGNIRNTRRGLSAFDLSASEDIAPTKEVVQRLLSFRERSLQNRMSLIWSDGRSLSDADAPLRFKNKVNELISLLSRRLPKHVFTSKMVFLLAFLHKDTTYDCVQWISDQTTSGAIRDPRAIGFALGDVSEQWQKLALSTLVAHPTKDALRVFAYAIWREQHFVEKFNVSELNAILNGLNTLLGQTKPCPSRRSENDNRTVRNWVRATSEPLELLLGLLRTRASSDSEIKMLLQPHQKITKELANQVERVTEIVAKSSAAFFSRVQINIQKPEGDRTPDLLYALRLYLTGDDGANAIHVTSVSEGDND